MKTQIHVLLWTIALIASAFGALAQPTPMKWGDIPLEDLEMTSYPADLNASAVVLGEYGEVEVNKDGAIEYSYHVRVKLLAEAANERWGVYSITYTDGDFPQHIDRIQAQTFILASGVQERHELDSLSIYEETITGDWKQYKFALPALQPGAVIEIRYSMTTERPEFFPNWSFQHDEPTRWSEYRARISNQIGYAKVAKNATFAIDEFRKVEDADGNTMVYRWVMKDVPALREVPFITTLEDYRAVLQFQRIGSMSILGPDLSWLELAGQLLDMPGFGKAMEGSRQIRRQTKSLIKGLDSPHEKLTAIEQFVRNSISWNGEYTFIAERKMDEVLESATGSSAEQTLLLIAMLRMAGIDAFPLLLSTRSHGAAQQDIAFSSQFNHVIAYAELQDQTYLIDVTEPLAPIDVLPFEVLNAKGWLIYDRAPLLSSGQRRMLDNLGIVAIGYSKDWIPIESQAKYSHKLTLEGELDERGAFSGRLRTVSKGYAALALRKGLVKEDALAVVKNEWGGHMGDMELIDMQVSNQEMLGDSLVIEASAHLENFGQAAGDFMYANSHVLAQFEENPLKLKKRTVPIDLGFPLDFAFTFRIKLPDGFVLDEQPDDLALELPKKGGAFLRSTTLVEDTLVIHSQFTLAKPKYEPIRYARLKELFNRLVAAQAEQFVLRRAGS